jgi:hypothetical protein
MVECKCFFPAAGVDSSSPLSYIKAGQDTGRDRSSSLRLLSAWASGEFKQVWRIGGEDGVVGGTRDIQRLPTTPFSLLVLRKEYFDCPKRDSHAVQHLKERSLYSCTL